MMAGVLYSTEEGMAAFVGWRCEVADEPIDTNDHCKPGHLSKWIRHISTTDRAQSSKSLHRATSRGDNRGSAL